MSRGELHASKWCRRTKDDRLKEKERKGKESNWPGVTAIYIKERRAPA